MKREGSNEFFEFTECEMLDDLLQGVIVCPEFRTNTVPVADLPKSLETKLRARRVSEAAMRVFLERREWLSHFAAYGVNKIKDVPWVRDIERRIAENEMKGRRRYHLSTLEEARRKLAAADGDETVIVPNFSGRGGYGKTRLQPKTEAVIVEVIEKAKLSKQPLVKRDLFERVVCEVQLHNAQHPEAQVVPPGQSTVFRRISQLIPQIEIDRKTLTARTVRRNYRSNSSPRFRPDVPLLVSEYDDTDTNVFLVGGQSGLPVGRCYLTTGICTGTLMPLGLSIGIEPRSFESAMSAIQHSLLPKDRNHADFQECNFGWESYGLQQNILMDNATYNHGNAMKHQSQEMQLKICQVKPFGPTAKSSIERFNNVAQVACRGLPGWRGLHDDPDAVKKGLATAVIPIQQFRTYFFKWITGDYMNNPGEDGLSPRQKWQSYFSDRSPRVRWSAEELAIFRLVPMPRSFRASGGVKRLNLTYDSRWLQEVREYFGNTKSICTYVDRFDLSYIIAEHPVTRELQRVPCTTADRYAFQLTEYAQKAILKMCRQRRIENPCLRDMQRERAELVKLTEQLSRSSKLRLRKVAEIHGRYVESPDGAACFKEEIKTVEKVMSALEIQMLEIEAIDLEVTDALF